MEETLEVKYLEGAVDKYTQHANDLLNEYVHSDKHPKPRAFLANYFLEESLDLLKENNSGYNNLGLLNLRLIALFSCIDMYEELLKKREEIKRERNINDALKLVLLNTVIVYSLDSSPDASNKIERSGVFRRKLHKVELEKLREDLMTNPKGWELIDSFESII